jgi:hypothetical protein
MPEPQILVEDLEKRFGDTVVLSGVHRSASSTRPGASSAWSFSSVRGLEGKLPLAYRRLY